MEATPTQFENAGAFREFVETAIVRSYLQRIAEERLRHELLDELTERAAKDDPPFELDYWRLNLRGRRPG